jgi:hypothetical protein
VGSRTLFAIRRLESVLHKKERSREKLLTVVTGFPWWRLATAVLLIVALLIALDAGRVIEALVIGVLALSSLVLLVLSLVACKRA